MLYLVNEKTGARIDLGHVVETNTGERVHLV